MLINPHRNIALIGVSGVVARLQNLPVTACQVVYQAFGLKKKDIFTMLCTFKS